MTLELAIVVGVLAGQFGLTFTLSWLLVKAKVNSELDKIRQAQEAAKLIQTNHAEVLANHGQSLVRLNNERTKRGLGG